jgi:hypothetical protein
LLVCFCRLPGKKKKKAGMPDFSWYNIPKREKYTKLPQKIPNVHLKYAKRLKIDPISIKYTNSFNCKTLQKLPKFGIFFGLKTDHLATLEESPPSVLSFF